MKLSLHTGLKNIKQHKVIFPLICCSAFLQMSNASFFPYITTYYKSNNIDEFGIGILSSVAPFVSLLIQPLWGVAADKTARHALFLKIVIIGSILSVLSYYFGVGFLNFFISILLFSIFYTTVSPLSDTVSVTQLTKHGYRYSVTRMAGSISYAVMVVIAGVVLRKYPSASFAMTSVFYLLMFLSARKIPEEKIVKASKEKMDFSSIFKNKRVMFVIVYVFAFQTALGLYSSFFSVYVVDLGYNNAIIGILMCIGALSEVPVLIYIDRVLNRFKMHNVMFFAGFMLILRILVATFSTNLVGLVLAQLLSGLSYMVLFYSSVTFMSTSLKPELRGTGQSVLYMVQSGLAAIFSNILGGKLIQIFGIEKTFLSYGAFLFVVTILMLFIPKMINKRYSK